MVQAVLFGASSLPRIQWSDHVEAWDLWFRLDGVKRAPRSYRDIVLVDAPAECGALMEHLTVDSIEGAETLEQMLQPRLDLIFSLLVRSAESKDKAPTLTPNQRLRLVRWTQEHLAVPPEPGDLARVVGLTPDYFARLFRSTFDLSPRDWLIRERLWSARRLIDSEGVPISEAMRRTGFSNPAHFSRIMKQVTGRTPKGKTGWRRGK